MIGEAFDTAVTLGLALLAWIALTAAVVTAGLVSLCVAVVWVCRGVWQGVAASLAALRHAQTARHPPAELPFPAPIASRRRPNPLTAAGATPGPQFVSPSPESGLKEKR